MNQKNNKDLPAQKIFYNSKGDIKSQSLKQRQKSTA